MSTEESTTTTIPTITRIDGPATVGDQGVTRGTQGTVDDVDLGVCYLDPTTNVGSTQYGFKPCGLDYDGEVVMVGGVPTSTTIAVAPVPLATTLPVTGSEPAMLGVGVLLVAIGLTLRRAVKP